MSCLFCEIVKGQIPAEVVYEDEHVLAFTDINPQAPVHFLMIPKEHIGGLNLAGQEHAALLGHMQLSIAQLAKTLDLDQSGYRVVTNIGDHGGQTVGHLHYHILGGRNLQWPPG